MARGSRRLVSQRGNGRLDGRTHQREMRARARRRSVPSQGELGRGESGRQHLADLGDGEDRGRRGIVPRVGVYRRALAGRVGVLQRLLRPQYRLAGRAAALEPYRTDVG